MRTIEELAKALSISESQLKGMRRKYRMDHGNEAEERLLAWLEHTWREMRDEDHYLRAGALPSDLGGKVTNPRDTALCRGRSGTTRDPGKGRRRHHKKVVKPPTAAQIAKAAEQSAYIPYRDSLDAGAVPKGVVREYSRQGWENFSVLKGEELARRQVRDRAERLRQAELELRQKGKSPDEYIQAVEEAIEAMRVEARAA